MGTAGSRKGGNVWFELGRAAVYLVTPRTTWRRRSARAKLIVVGGYALAGSYVTTLIFLTVR